jgi:hypothetical protein
MMLSKQYSALVPTLFHWPRTNGKPMRSIDGRLVAALVLAAAVGHRSVRGCGSKWRTTAAVCGRLRRGGQQQQRSQAQGTIDAGGPVQKQAPLELIPARHRSAPAAIL